MADVQTNTTRRDALESAIGHSFSQPELLDLALIHRSYAAEEGTSDNERLEFLGDAVLDVAVSEMLMDRDADMDEGELSRSRAALVSEDALAGVACKLGLDLAIKLGKGEESSQGRTKPRLLASVYEAVIGAVFRDGGYLEARSCIQLHLADSIAGAAEALRDHKTKLQELTQQRSKVIPSYEITGVEGPEHEPIYHVRVLVEGKVLGDGRGSSRKSAEQAAAERALAVLRGLRE